MSDDARAAELRKLFPVVDQWTYLYSGSIHPCAIPVGNAMRNFIERWQDGGEDAFFYAYEKFAELKEKFARLIHGSARNIVVTESTTAALNLAGQLVRPQADQNVVVTDLAFMSSTYPWLVSQGACAQVRFVANRGGRIEMDDLAAQVDKQTAALSICAVTVGSGFRFDLSAVAEIADRHGAALIVDGAQALGLIDVNVDNSPVDFLATTASKWLMGPAGVGFAYVADKYLDAPPPSTGWLAAANIGDWDVRHCKLHEDAMRFQGGIPNLVGVVGALAGLELLEDIGRPFIERRVRQLTRYALEQLDRIGVQIWTPRADHERAGIVFFRTADHEALHARLKAERVYCGTFLGGIRIDPTFYNTQEDLDKFLAIVRSHAGQHPN